MHPHLYFIPLIVVVGAIFLFVMWRRNRRHDVGGRPDATNPQHLEKDDDPARRRAIARGEGGGS